MTFLDWLNRLISFDTTSRNSNVALMQAVQAWFNEQQIKFRLTYNEKRDKANLFAILPGEKGELNDGLILSGHTDVVPVDDQVWDTPPFTATQAEDKIYGRGTADMKGFIAVVLSLVPKFKKFKLKKPIYFAFSYDEEVGCCGAPIMIADIQAANIKPDACIVGEPSMMQPVIAHKGSSLYKCVVKGCAAHSSLTPKGCNAIDYASEMILFIRDLAQELAKKSPKDEDFDVPYTTISTNRIFGGTANNIIPGTCEFYFDLRNLPRVKPSEIIQKIKNYAEQKVLPKMQCEEAAISIEEKGSAPSFEHKTGSKIEQLVHRLSGEKTTKVAYATEAGLFQNANIPTIICGPGSIEQAHRPNEFVTIEQLERCEKCLCEVVEEFCVS